MISFRRTRSAFVVLLATTLAGCIPTGSNQPDEEKEAHFQTGRARVNGMDYRGAVEAFQKAVEVNPRSGAAHFELGWLLADKQPDPAAAIYHYERYLALRPKADNAETIRQHILRLKQELAKAVLPLPSAPGTQRQLDQLMEENRRLQDELGRCRADTAKRSAEPFPHLPGGDSSAVRPATTTGGGIQAAAEKGRSSPATGPGAAPAAPTRTHKVQGGETLSSIARKYHVKLEALNSANPGLNARRVQVGHVLKIPAS